MMRRRAFFAAPFTLAACGSGGGGGAIPPAPAGAPLYVACGDSITAGSAYPDRPTYAALLAVSRGWQCINLAVGGSLCVPDHGERAGLLAPSRVTYLIGYNEFYAQTAPGEFCARYRQFIARLFAVRPEARLAAITPTWSPHVRPIPLEAYREAIRAAVAGDARVQLVEGESLARGDLSRFPDGVHPDEAGTLEIAAALARIVK